MRKTALTMLAVTSTLVLGGMVRANAATITETVDFTASGFTPSGSPVDPWTGSFTITFDPTVASSGSLDAFSSNLPASYGTFAFNYLGPGFNLEIGDNCTPGCGVAATLDNAELDLSVTASGGLTFADAIIGSTSVNSLSHTNSGTVGTTPLPAALPLFATGLAGLGLLGWRRKRKGQRTILAEEAQVQAA